MLRSILQNSTAGFYIFASDSTTPTSGKTGLTITTTLSKVGGTANSVSPTITEIGNGLYWVAPIAAHRDTLGEIAWQFSGTGAIIAPRLEKVVLFNDQVARGGASAAGDAMALTSSERTTFAGVLEAAMLNEADGQALLAGIQAQLQAIFDQAGDVPVVTLVNQIVAGVWAAASRTLTGTVTLAASQPNYAPSKAGDAMALTAGERSAVAAAIEVEFMNDLSGGAFMQAISDKLSALLDQSTDLPVTTLRDVIVAGVWSAATRTLTSIPNVTVGGYASGQDPGTLLSSTVSKVSTIDAIIAALTEVVSAVTRFRASALAEAPGSAGGLTSEQQAQLDRIESAASRIQGKSLQWVGNVGDGGVLQLTLGDDHESVIGNALSISVTDPGGVKYARWTESGATLQWGAGQNTGGATLITGTVAGVSHNSTTEITTVTVEVPNCAANGNALAPYTWQLQRTKSGKRSRELQGTLNLRPDMIGA